MFPAVEQAWMRSALRLAARGRWSASPNPMVGALVVREGAVVGSGWHRRPGTLHAEALALQEAGSRARGATVFVTLEPCVHHGRTPPCVDALIDAGVSRVVAAVRDPDPRTAGKGFNALRAAGIEVAEGLMQEEARRLNEAYFHHRTTGRPFVVYKVAASLDGKTAAVDGSSQWITGEKARSDAHRLRAESDAICAGVGTILTDDPQLTVRGVRARKIPVRVVVDSRGRTPATARFLSPEAPSVVVTALDETDPALISVREAGAAVVSMPDAAGRVDLPAMLNELGRRDIVSMLLEGGATLAGAFAAQGLIDKFVFYLAPKLLGGEGHGCLERWGAASIEGAIELGEFAVVRVGSDLRITAYPKAA